MLSSKIRFGDARLGRVGLTALLMALGAVSASAAPVYPTCASATTLQNLINDGSCELAPPTVKLKAAFVPLGTPRGIKILICCKPGV